MKRLVLGLMLVLSLVAAGCQRVPGAGTASASASASASAAGVGASMAASPSASGSYAPGGNGY